MCKYVLLSLALLPALAGCNKKAKLTEEDLAAIPQPLRTGLPQASGGFVLSVGGETITADQIIAPLMNELAPIAKLGTYHQFKRQAQTLVEQTLAAKISNILLYKKAKKHAGENIDEALEKAVDSEVRKFIVRFGGDTAKAEQALKEMAMDWKSFKDYQRKMLLSQAYVSSQLPDDKPITYSELMTYYQQNKDKLFTKPAMITFRLIDIHPDKLTLTDPNQTAEQQALRLADELLEKLRKGADFAKLASTYSHGHRAMFGGLWKPIQPDSLAKPYDLLAAHAKKMRPGQLAGPIQAPNHVFIMKLEKKQEKTVVPFENVQDQIEAKLQIAQRRKAIDQLSTELMQQAAIANSEEFVDFCLHEIYRRANSPQ